MSLPVHFLPEARAEYDSAVDWYEEQREGLGVTFIGRVREVIRRIAATPRIHAVVHNGVRKAVVKQFPFIVLYREDDTEVLIVGVFHTSRDPSEWMRLV